MVTLHQTTQNSNTYMYKKFKFLQLKGVCELIGELKNPIGSYSTVPLIIFFYVKDWSGLWCEVQWQPEIWKNASKGYS